jgi:hypothetical protein
MAVNGDTAKGCPKYWSVENGKLYLNYDADIQNSGWKMNLGLLKKGDAMWPSVLN